MATEQTHEDWGNVRIKNELLSKIDKIKRQNQSRSEFVTDLILRELYA